MPPIASIHSTLAAPAEAIIMWLAELGLGWGLAIIAATFVVRLIVSPFAYRQIRSMATMRAMGDDVKLIRKHYGDDMAGMTGAMERLYKDNSFHPLSFIWPALLQAPFFMTVFFYLNSTAFKADIGNDRGFLFVNDLTAASSSSAITLLGLVGAYLGVQIFLLLFQSQFKPERKALVIGIVLPAVITLFLIHFPAALMLYWTAGMMGLLIQQIIMRILVDEPEIVHWQAPKGSKKREPKPPVKQNAFAKILADAQATQTVEQAHDKDVSRKDETGSSTRGEDGTMQTSADEAADPSRSSVTSAKKPHPKSKKRKHGRRR